MSSSIVTVHSLLENGHLYVADGNHGQYRPRRHEYVEQGTAIIKVPDIVEGEVDFENCQRINDTALDRIRKGFGKSEDTLLTHKGTVGNVGWVRPDSEPFVASPQTTIWRTLNKEIINEKYLYYYLNCRYFQTQINAVKSETDMADYVSLTNQRAFEIHLPDISIQKEIVSTMSEIDNRRWISKNIAETCLSLIDKHFQHQFGDAVFEGMNGGKIPDNFRVGSILDLANLVPNGIDTFDGVKPYIATADVDNMVIRPSLKKITHKKRPGRANMQPCLNSLWFAKMKDSDKFMTYTKGNSEMIGRYILSTGFFGLTPKKDIHLIFLFASIRNPHFLWYKNSFASGTTQEALNQESLSSIPFVIPPEKQLIEYCKFAFPLLDLMNAELAIYEEMTKLKEMVFEPYISKKLGYG